MVSTKESSQSQIIMSGISIHQTLNSNEKTISDSFQEKKTAYISREIATISTDTTVNQISKIFLEILNTIFPDTYKKNLDNYTAFQKYIQTTTSTIDKINDPNIQQDIIDNANRGIQETKLYKQRLQLFRR